VEVTEVDKFNNLESAISKLGISGDEVEGLQRRFPPDSVETSGGIVVLHFKLSDGKKEKMKEKPKAKPKAKAKAKPKKKGKGEEEDYEDDYEI